MHTDSIITNHKQSYQIRGQWSCTHGDFLAAAPLVSPLRRGDYRRRIGRLRRWGHGFRRILRMHTDWIITNHKQSYQIRGQWSCTHGDFLAAAPLVSPLRRGERGDYRRRIGRLRRWGHGFRRILRMDTDLIILNPSHVPSPSIAIIG